MFLFSETKKLVKSGVAALGVAALLLPFSAVFLSADQATDLLNAQKAERQRKLTQIASQIKGYQQQISDTQKKASSLKNEIYIYDAQIASTELQIQAKETQIDDTQLQIQELQALIEKKQQEISDNRKVLAQLITELGEYDDSYLLRTTLGSGSLSDFLDQVQYTTSLQDRVYQLLQRIKELKARLEREQADLKVQLTTLEELKEQLEISRSSLAEQRGQKQTLLTQTRGVEKNFQKLLQTSKNDELALQREIDDLDAQIRAKLGKRTIGAKKGVLSWPMDGVLTQGYGNTGFTALGYNFHNGIDIAAPAGTPLYAAADGVVTYVDSSDTSYGNWASILHTIKTRDGSTAQIVTLYAHMRSYRVHAGQRVSEGDLIGYEGNTGNTTKKLYGPERGYHIHFGVYDAEGFGVKNGAYTNIYGPYRLPYGYTYNPLDFLQ